MAQIPTPPAIPPSSPVPPPAQPSSNRTLMLVLAYLGILALVPLLVEKDDREIQWHAKNGLVMTVTWIVLFIVLNVASWILGTIPGIGGLVSAIFGCGLTMIIWLVIMAIHIIAIMKALKGERLMLPLISDYVNKWQ